MGPPRPTDLFPPRGTLRPTPPSPGRFPGSLSLLCSFRAYLGRPSPLRVNIDKGVGVARSGRGTLENSPAPFRPRPQGPQTWVLKGLSQLSSESLPDRCRTPPLEETRSCSGCDPPESGQGVGVGVGGRPDWGLGSHCLETSRPHAFQESSLRPKWAPHI